MTNVNMNGLERVPGTDYLTEAEAAAIVVPIKSIVDRHPGLSPAEQVKFWGVIFNLILKDVGAESTRIDSRQYGLLSAITHEHMREMKIREDAGDEQELKDILDFCKEQALDFQRVSCDMARLYQEWKELEKEKEAE